MLHKQQTLSFLKMNMFSKLEGLVGNLAWRRIGGGEMSGGEVS